MPFRTRTMLLSIGFCALAFLEEPARSADVVTPAPKVGSLFPDITLQAADGKAHHLSSLRGGKRAVLVLIPALASASECERETREWRRLQETLNERKMQLFLISDRRNECELDQSVFLNAMGDFSRFFRSATRGHAFVDQDGSLRWLRTSPGLMKQTVEVARNVQLWDNGRIIFEIECGHCHGNDGLDTSYPNVKTMAGITKRMDQETILRRASEAGAVDIDRLGERERDALYAFLSGL